MNYLKQISKRFSF